MKAPSLLSAVAAVLVVLAVADDGAAQPAQPQPPQQGGQGAQEQGQRGQQAEPQPGDEPPLLPPDAETEPEEEPEPAPAKGQPKPEAAETAPKKPAAAAEAKKPTPKGDSTESDTYVFAEDWWMGARPVFEIHGYYRVRAEFLSHFALGRKDTPANVLWPQPADNDYIDTAGNRNVVDICGEPLENAPCDNNVQAGANMRFRLAPELHISDNVRVLAQIDLLDNVVLGSTPEGYSNQPGESGGYTVRQRGGYTPIGAFSSTQWAPSAGQNSFTDSIVVKRVWGEYMTPIGMLRFGRMPSHWGLGMFVNAGDGYDNDWGSTADRLMFVTGIKSIDLYFAGLWDFANEGATSAIIGQQQGQPYDLIQSDDVNQWGLVVVRRRQADLAKKDLADGGVVANGGVYAVYREQSLDANVPLGGRPAATGSSDPTALVRRGAQAVIPDFWFQFLWNKLRIEAEAVLVWGGIENTNVQGDNNYVNPNGNADENGWNIRQFGIATQAEFRAFEDKLRVSAGFGYATGDDDVEGIAPPAEGFDAQLTSNRTFSTFRFHPDYRVDLILWRNILQRIQAAYYVRPSVEYDFNREPNGQRIGGGAALIWSRASQFVQTPGNSHDLGLELDFKLYYQAKDGALNDDPDKMGGFFTQIEYGVMFPLGGLGYLPGEEQDLADANNPVEIDTAQTLRWYMGILF
jgi:uncharacterized protein (TIGR04551 family)